MNRLEAVVKLRKLAARHTIAGVGKLPPIERRQREGPGCHRQAEPRRRIHYDFSFARSARLLFLRVPCVLRPSFAMNLIRLLLCAFCFLTVNALAAPVIVIDAGHGGFDRGGMPGQKVPEKGFALDVAKRLDATLRAAGYRTVMTRSTDVFVTLGDRCAISNKNRGAVFVSIHFNGASNADAHGIETYYYSGRGSSALATAIHRKVLAATGEEDRRVRTRPLFVLRKNRNTAVLCELGFLTNRSETRKISTASYRQKLAEAVAAGIRSRY
jgi:N-acetylmuramoyl-L-alanine amidase